MKKECMKRFLSVLCLLALLAGVLVLPPAASAEGEGTLRVGYGIHDITPQTSTPMAGYGDNFSRMSRVGADGKPILIESNGDGVVDENDGLFVTCIAVTDQNDRTMLIFSYDVINASAELVKKLRARVLARWGIPGEYVMLNASHTHSGPDLSAYFSYVSEHALDAEFDGDTFTSTYYSFPDNGYPERQGIVQDMQRYVYNVLLAGMMAAAEQAMADRTESEMRIGTVTAPNMNFIRHYYNDINSTDPADVYGSNTRGGGTYRKHYADANPTMYLVEFVRGEKQPVVMVDWRAHSTASSTRSNTYGLANHYNISPEYISAFRRALAQAGYLASFFQGTAGNAVMGSSVGNKIDENNATDRDVVASWTYDGKTQACVISYLYGAKLATYALQGLQENMTAARTGTVLARQSLFYADRDTRDNFKMVGGAYPDGTEVPGMLYEKVTDSKGDEYSVYDYLHKYYAVYASVPAAEKTLVTAMLDKYNLNSVYHLSRIKSKFTNTMQQVKDGDGNPVTNAEGDPLYEPKANIQNSFYLNAFCIGPDFACVTAPFETFDYPYTFRGQKFAMTFVLGYTNASDGYMPTADTYEFAKGRGAYEANNTAYAAGTAEAIAERHRQMLEGLDRSALPAVCPACGAEAVLWEPLPSGHITTAGHYYLPEDMNIVQKNVNAAGGTVCLHMNGHSLIDTYAASSRCFAIQGSSTLNILGSGLIQSQGVAPDNSYTNGGAILVNSGTTLNLYEATVRYLLHDGQWIRQGAAVYVGGTMNMYGGRLEMVKADEDAGITTENGGVVCVGSKGVFNMTGGALSGGEVTGLGDCLAAAAGAKVTVGGASEIDGGVYLTSGVDMTLTGSPVIRQGTHYALFVAEGAALTDISGLADGAEIWISADTLPRTFAAAAGGEHVKQFRYDGEGRIGYNAAGDLFAAEPRTGGDLGGDGKVNGKDVVMLQRYLAGGYGDFIEVQLADLNGDGKVNGKDSVMLQRFVAGGYGVTL